ncbi:hypothetical protein SAMN05421858_0109 [Haladaptatus litoreus]|uniref:PIN domain-containing protein n=1 Tax=Haladaptatus litoreus TaxID=553468 RepID=A0A1N6UV60_9EURY|nr:PIN domain-containing protein [Haladaptatus litoreus]SIQ69513.1 hypothetical protein SAMN05421858_0109 [Haladaptatus litoreus]
MTVFELFHAIERTMDSESEREKVRNVIETKTVVPADTPVMRKAGRLHGALQNDGTPIGESDCIIAATGLIADEPILTRNVTHFERIDGLQVESY